MKYLLLFLSLTCNAVELQKIDLGYQRFHDSNRIPDLNGFKAKEGLSLGVNIDLWGPFYFDNRIISYTDEGSYRLIGWNFHLGAQVFKSLKVEYEHFSKHLLDHDDHGYLEGKFPVQDSIGIVWTIYSKSP